GPEAQRPRGRLSAGLEWRADAKEIAMFALDDRTLSETGLEVGPGRAGAGEMSTSAAPGRVLLIACGALAREIIALRDANRWTNLDLACLPAKLHNQPQKIPEAVRARVRQARAEGYDRIFIVYAD